MEISEKTVENNDNFNIFTFHFIAELNNKIDLQNQEIHHLKSQIDWFKDQFKLSNVRHFGKSSETTSSIIQVSLFDEAMSEVESKNDPAEQTETVTYTRKKKTVGRQLDISKFPKEQIIHDLKEEDKICDCGKALEKAGEDKSTQIDHVPESFKVIEHIALKYCCRPCDIMRSAKKPETAIPKCMATAGFVAEVISKKYEQHLPLYRQSKIFERSGAVIPDNTLGNWVMGAAKALERLDDAQREQIQIVSLIQADETKIKTLKPNKEGYFWGYHSPNPINRFVLFEYSPSRGAFVPNSTLKDFSGLLQTDGYCGYNDLRAKPVVISIGCWDHARRRFVDVVKIAGKNKNGKAETILLLINRLYQIEREAEGMNPEDRKAYRQEKARPVLDTIHTEAISTHAPPKTLLGIAITYLLNQWPYLIKYIDHGEAPISNCWMENQIRPFALGRRNWLFSGTPNSANKAALLYSLIQTCHLNNINARKYLKYVLNQAHAMRRGDMLATSLLPQFIDKSILD